MSLNQFSEINQTRSGPRIPRRRGRRPSRGRQHTILPIFQKLHEVEKLLGRMGTLVPGVSPYIRHCSLTNRTMVLLCCSCTTRWGSGRHLADLHWISASRLEWIIRGLNTMRRRPGSWRGTRNLTRWSFYLRGGSRIEHIIKLFTKQKTFQ